MIRFTARLLQTGIALGVLAAGVSALPGCREGAAAPPALRINGSTTVNLPVAEAAEVLRAERGLKIEVDTQGGSAGGISSLAAGRVQIGMISRPLTDEDRTKHPGVAFHATPIGEDAVALVVSKDVWEAGVRSIGKSDARGIYEGSITNWKQLGGPDRRIAFFNKEPGRGTWEVFVHWAYGTPKQAPAVNFPEVGGNEETRSKVASTPGAISQLSSSWADGVNVFALAIKGDDGGAVYPLPGDIAERRYPMSRPLLLITNGPPAGDARLLVEFLLSDRGQALVRKHGYLGVDQLK